MTDFQFFNEIIYYNYCLWFLFHTLKDFLASKIAFNWQLSPVCSFRNFESIFYCFLNDTIVYCVLKHFDFNTFFLLRIRPLQMIVLESFNRLKRIWFFNIFYFFVVTISLFLLLLLDCFCRYVRQLLKFVKILS